MANIKLFFTHDDTGESVYGIIERMADNYLLNDADGSFAITPADPYIAFSEHSVIKGEYSLSESRTTWNNGLYKCTMYEQAGGSPIPASDIVLAYQLIYIDNDLEVINEAEVKGLNGDAMRGTDSAALATVCTEARLSELDAANIPADVDTLLSRISSAVATALTKLADVAIAGTETAGSLFKLFYDRVTGAVALDSTVAKEANIETHVTNSLNSYDPPTKTELDTIESNIRGTDLDTLKTLSDQIDNVEVPSGASTVTIIINDGSNPLSDVFVAIKNNAQTVLLYATYTDSNGQITCALNDGTYKVILRKFGYTFTVPETLTVSGTTSDTYSGSANDVGTPTDVDACRVYEYCFLADDETPMTSVNEKLRIMSLPYDYDGKLHSGDDITGVYSSVTGLLYWDIVVGAIVRVKIKDLGIDDIITIPDLTNVRLSTLL